MDAKSTHVLLRQSPCAGLHTTLTSEKVQSVATTPPLRLSGPAVSGLKENCPVGSQGVVLLESMALLE